MTWPKHKHQGCCVRAAQAPPAFLVRSVVHGSYALRSLRRFLLSLSVVSRLVLLFSSHSRSSHPSTLFSPIWQYLLRPPPLPPASSGFRLSLAGCCSACFYSLCLFFIRLLRFSFLFSVTPSHQHSPFYNSSSTHDDDETLASPADTRSASAHLHRFSPARASRSCIGLDNPRNTPSLGPRPHIAPLWFTQQRQTRVLHFVPLPPTETYFLGQFFSIASQSNSGLLLDRLFCRRMRTPRQYDTFRTSSIGRSPRR